MSRNYVEAQKEKQGCLIKMFNGDHGKGLWTNPKTGEAAEYDHILQNFGNNLFEGIREEAVKNFPQGKWHRDCGHGNSSQAACVNHLYPIMRDGKAILAMLNGVCGGEVFSEVVPLFKDEDGLDVFVAFEVVDKNDSLKEGAHKTAIDAIVVAKNVVSQKNTLVVFEWKYTESYGDVDKSAEKEGLSRMDRYDGLIKASEYVEPIVSADGRYPYKGGVVYHEPFYQLMRQTLWAELFVQGRVECENSSVKVEDYLHLHVIPEGNEKLLGEYKVSGKKLIDSWRDVLTEEGRKRYKIVDPGDLFEPVVEEFSERYSELFWYLAIRYW
ncbi:MAG: hypothetical protein LUD72_03640 [Bacteroidales bacterium]|nr:hypothetical protein [Bacteroidales bacterium]